MSITITSIGDNTVQITTSGTGNSFSALTTAVAAAITGSNPVKSTGWTLLDSVATGVGLTQVFQALNIDGVTYKNIILRWNIFTGEINTSTCESWNVTTHTATNEAWTFYDCAPISFNMSGCDLIIFVHPRWCALHSYVASEQGLWAGTFEMSREDANDTAANGIPCWGWISSTLWMLGSTSYTGKPLQGVDHTLCSVPRTKSGMTGVNAAKSWAADFGTISYPHISHNSQTILYQLQINANKFFSTIWNTAKKMALPIKPVHNYNGVYIENKGMISGLKLLPNIGGNMQKVKINVDSNGNYAAGGASTDHWVLNNHYKTYDSSSTAWAGNTNWTSVDVVVGNGLETITGFVFTGYAYYVITTGRLSKILLFNYQNFDLSMVVYKDIKYDGERYVYLSSSTGLSRLDTTDDSIVNLTIANGVQAFSITDQHIVCAQATSAAIPTITRVLRSTFAVDSTNGSFSLATFTVAVTLADAVTDFAGNVIFVPYVGSSSQTYFKLVKISPAGVASYHYVGGYTAATSTVTPTLFMVGRDELAVVQNYSNTIYVSLLQASTLAVISQTTINGSYGGDNSATKGLAFKLGGVLVTGPRVHTSYGTGQITLGNSAVGFVTPVVGPTLGTFTDAHYMPMNYDGSRLVVGTSTGLRIWSNVNGEYVQSNIQIGQTLLPA